MSTTDQELLHQLFALAREVVACSGPLADTLAIEDAMRAMIEARPDATALTEALIAVDLDGDDESFIHDEAFRRQCFRRGATALVEAALTMVD